MRAVKTTAEVRSKESTGKVAESSLCGSRGVSICEIESGFSSPED